MDEQTFEGSGGLKLFARSWHPEGKPRALIVILHGFKSHSGMYEWPAEQLTKNGLAVYAPDLRGHGKSGGERYHVDKFDDYVKDLERFVTIARAQEPGIPFFLFGHSAGGVVSCLYTLTNQKEMAGLICEDFANELPPPEIVQAFLKGVGDLAPHAHLLNLKDEYFSRDPSFVAKMRNDPLVVHTQGTAQLLAELIRADQRLKHSFQQIKLPLLILHGSADRLAKVEGSQRFYDTAGSSDKVLKIYEGHFHDSLNDIGKQQVMADILDWLKAHMTTGDKRARPQAQPAPRG